MCTAARVLGRHWHPAMSCQQTRPKHLDNKRLSLSTNSRHLGSSQLADPGPVIAGCFTRAGGATRQGRGRMAVPYCTAPASGSGTVRNFARHQFWTLHENNAELCTTTILDFARQQFFTLQEKNSGLYTTTILEFARQEFSAMPDKHSGLGTAGIVNIAQQELWLFHGEYSGLFKLTIRRFAQQEFLGLYDKYLGFMRQ